MIRGGFSWCLQGTLRNMQKIPISLRMSLILHLRFVGRGFDRVEERLIYLLFPRYLFAR